MVHAQISCSRFVPQSHGDYDIESDSLQTYLKRGSLNYCFAGDIFAAMCSFGLTLPNLPHKTVEQAYQEVDCIKNVKRYVIKGCRVQFNPERDSALYDPDCKEQFTPVVDPHSGVISARMTAGGAHFYECIKETGTDQERMNAAVRYVNRTYCQPTKSDPGRMVLPPFALDGQDRVYILDQGNIEVPVLQYGNDFCVDYTPDAIIKGIMVIDNVSGTARKCVTRDLYELPNPDNIYSAIDSVKYTRRIKGSGFVEPLGTQQGTHTSLNHIQYWLQSTGALLNADLNLPCPALGLQTMHTPGTDADSLFSYADKSMLGGPLPIKLIKKIPGSRDPLKEDGTCGPLFATARVAPLIQYDGVNYQARFDHDGKVDVDALAQRMSRMGHRNIIGVAMQRIKTNTQGDLMLHDGV